MKQGVICLGEALIDFIPLDQDNMQFLKSPGGAPANVAVGVARLGAKSSFIGKVGDDVLGNFLKQTLENYNVQTGAMFLSKEVRTGLVFVTLDEEGEREFSFYIEKSADRFLTPEEIPASLFDEHNVFHFGSISLIDDPAESATKKALQLAKEKGLLVSYDPNLRPMLWESLDIAKQKIVSMLSEADVVKLSEVELEFITGETDIERGVEKLAEYNIPLLFITLGKDGVHAFYKGEAIFVKAQKVKSVDTTGAGDAFVSGLLYRFSERDIKVTDYTLDEIKEIATFASVSGALAVSQKGAMSALPTIEQVQAFLAGK
ncbi:aminoimidazole riboside kinase [Fredinandcohnia sp. QZ13]|uniref:aminoimidazole riboside kinase n=1 Tax=Fredinandcohnia sp. QZ13 TaxID=3073144 RepID=UPI0028536D39|nr:aminoimidazole riboside kinase [Fredinandcohnia sp. QZ13]MDR4890344.1 aminoimidazole riboside kinase [Fredinandcohnia sp. QZ13]